VITLRSSGDRDLLLERAADRRGVPQGRHAHALLARGAQILEELFPGLLADLAAAGVPVLASPGELWFSVGVICCAWTSRSGTGARWPGWSPRRPGTGSPASGCGLPAANKKK
jgi:hypothetical protein